MYTCWWIYDLFFLFQTLHLYYRIGNPWIPNSRSILPIGNPVRSIVIVGAMMKTTTRRSIFVLPNMWEYNKQIDSGRGCWSSTVCSGSAAYELFDGRKLQFWCTGQQASKAAEVEIAPFGLTWGTRSIAIDFRMVCTQDSDCPYYDDPEYNQECLSGTNKQKIYGFFILTTAVHIHSGSSFIDCIILMVRLFVL